MPRSSVIIPVFDHAAMTAQCLDTLLGSCAEEVIVVDDASTDNTARMLASFGDRIRVVSHPANAGFATSCNDGAATSSGEYLIFLNNDTIPQRGWIEALAGYADSHPNAAVIGAKLLYPNNTIQHAGVVVCQDRYPRHIYTGFPADHPAVCKSRRFQAVTAACMLLRRQVFEGAGGFDTAFRNGFEDVDLCLRLGARGHEVHFCADSVLLHLESISPGRFKHDRENVALYRQRWFDRVVPDDLDYYQEDGLLRLSYEGRYPLALEVSPLLAAVDGDGRAEASEQLLQTRSREMAELLRENTRLSLELSTRTADSPELRYRQLRQRIRELVQKLVPTGATVLVVSKGDGALLDLPERQGWHFPQTERGAYAGHHPANSAEAIAHLEALRAEGAEFLLLPAPSLWWLDHYAEFRQHLEVQYVRLAGTDDACLIYALSSPIRVLSGVATNRQSLKEPCT